MMVQETFFKTDVLVIGGGLSGLFAAIKAREAGADVIIAEKGHAGHSGAALYAMSTTIFNQEWGHDLGQWMDHVYSRAGRCRRLSRSCGFDYPTSSAPKDAAVPHLHHRSKSLRGKLLETRGRPQTPLLVRIPRPGDHARRYLYVRMCVRPWVLSAPTTMSIAATSQTRPHVT